MECGATRLCSKIKSPKETGKNTEQGKCKHGSLQTLEHCVSNRLRDKISIYTW